MEPCFKNGDAAWGHMGSVLCLHATELSSNEGSIAVCGLDDQEVQSYANSNQYEMAKHCVKCVYNHSRWIMLCVKCKWFYENGRADESLEDLFKEESI